MFGIYFTSGGIGTGGMGGRVGDWYSIPGGMYARQDAARSSLFQWIESHCGTSALVAHVLRRMGR